MKKQVLPSINVPMSEKTGDVSFPWYMYFKKVADAVFGTFRSVFHNDTLEGDGTEESPLGVSKKTLDSKVDKAGDIMSGELTVPELTVAGEEGALNVSVIGNTPTIASNNGMDVLAATTFDKATKTNDSTTWDKASSVDLVRKAQVATALTQKQDIATAVNYDNITNCITEIPQDIKLELADGVLTLKSGSKVYLATGNSSFPAQTVDADIEYTTVYSGQYVVIRNSQTSLYIGNIGSCTSGKIADRPTSIPNSAGLYFATDENKMYLTGNSGKDWYSTSYMTLPIAIITVSDGAISSIDHIFNGFGYIGSTVFILPSVKGLIPNGRNADGTLKNTSLTTSSVVINTYTGTNNNLYVGFVGANIYFNNVSSVSYNSFANTTSWGVCIIARMSATGGKTTSFEPKTAFHAVDYSALEELDNSVVHKTGDETIDGIKTFTARITYKSTRDYSTTDASSATSFADQLLVGRDNNNKSVSIMYSQRVMTTLRTQTLYRTFNSTADKYMEIVAWMKDDASHGAYITANGGTNTCLSSASSSTSDNNIALKGWVNNPSMSTNVVHRTGTEEVDGLKLFKGDVRVGRIALKSDTYKDIQWIDEAGVRVGTARAICSADGSRRFEIFAAKEDGSRTTGIVNYFNADGKEKSSCVTPDYTSNDTSIATTNFVKRAFANSGYGLATFSKAQQGYYKFSNGLIIQWGQSSGTAVPRTVTMPTAFTGAKTFKAFIQPLVAGALANFYQPGVDDTSQTTTTFKAYSSGNVSGTGWHWFAIGY